MFDDDQPERFTRVEVIVAMLSQVSNDQLSRMILQAMAFSKRSPLPLSLALLKLIASTIEHVDTSERTRFINLARDTLDELERADLIKTETRRY
jgi:hypothetical protein